MVLDDKMATNKETDGQDQSGAGLQSFNIDDFMNLEGDDANLFGTPSLDKTNFDFDFGASDHGGNEPTSGSRRSTQTKDAGAPFSLALPQDPAPVDEAIGGKNGELTMPTSSAPMSTSNQHTPPISKAGNQTSASNETALDLDFILPDSVLAVLDSALAGNGNGTANTPAGSTAANPYLPQQELFMPVPHPPGMVSSLGPYFPASPPQHPFPPGRAQYPPHPQHMAGMPPYPVPGLYPLHPPYPYAPPPGGHPQPVYQFHGVPQLTSTPLPPTKKIRHRRDGNRRESNRPSRWYRPLSPPPTAWSPPIPTRKKPRGRGGAALPLFRYNAQGELPGNARFSSQELEAFVSGPAGDGWAPSRRDHKLTAWIQMSPAFDAHRYGPEASICRWEGCPVKKNTVSKGQFRVALDESAGMSGRETDPFHVAGYMHLYCFEEVFDLYGLLFDARLVVRPDTRTFPCEEKNPMALGGDLVAALEAWVSREGMAREENGGRGRRRRRRRERKLWYALTEAHTASPGYLERLGKQNDIHLGKYMGDLELYQRLKDEKLQMGREKRVAIEIEDDEEAEQAPRRAETASDSRTVTRFGAGHDQVAALRNSAGRSSRKRSRLADGVGEPAHQMPPAKRLSRIISTLKPAIDAMPQYKRLEVESLVAREADRVKEGVVTRWGSLPVRM